jgi:DNA polymerase gamma 1
MRSFHLIRCCSTSKIVLNEVGIQMLPQKISNILFPGPSPEVKPFAIEIAQHTLKRFGLLGKTLEPLPNPEFDLIPLCGKNIHEHFLLLGLEQCQETLDLALRRLKAPTLPFPKQWKHVSGWTRYAQDGSSESVNYPLEDTLVFDVETCPLESPFPILATAVSSEAWYLWISPDLLKHQIPSTLIPMGTLSQKKLIIGHHVAFDRSFIEEEYNVLGSESEFLDTMSLHYAVSGLSNQQKGILRKLSKNEDDIPLDVFGNWIQHTALASLKDVVRLHLNKPDLEKSMGVQLTKTRLDDILPQLNSIIDYCAKDVQVTLDLFKVLFPKFRQKAVHPVSFAGILKMGKSFLPVTESWKQYIKKSDDILQSHQDEMFRVLEQAVNDALVHQKGDAWKTDPWLRHLDWTVKELPPRQREAVTEKQKESDQQRAFLSGKPQWFRDLWDRKTNTLKLSTCKRIVPYILKLEWNGYPLEYSKEHKWIYRVPQTDEQPQSSSPLLFNSDDKNFEPKYLELSQSYRFYKIPHKDGDEAACGNPLGKFYLSKFESGELKSNYSMAKKILKLQGQCSYWIGNQNRIKEQLVIWEKQVGLGSFSGKARDGTQLGVILPRMAVMGTVTRRAVESTWLTASNAKTNRVGSELKSMIKAPQGYSIVGADVDSEELWIASLYGDCQFKIHGGTPLGFMTLQGTKALGTDMHSQTAQLLGASRDSAKIFNYSRIYGAGIRHSVQLLKQFKPTISENEAVSTIMRMYEQTKGSPGKKTIKDGQVERLWHGGSESMIFNILERIIGSSETCTPTLRCRIPDGLSLENTQKQVSLSLISSPSFLPLALIGSYNPLA